MKKIKLIILFSLIGSLFFLGSCKKDLETEGVSRITYFPEFKVTGDVAQSVIVGSTYTDPGVKAYENGAEIPVKITGSVDSKTPGAYVLTFTATNKDGYSAYVYRVVGVITSDAAADDLSGSYQRNAGKKGIAVWEKVANGIYTCSDVGGAQLNASVYVVNIKKGIIVVPNQPLSGIGGSPVSCLNGDGSSEIPFVFGPAGTISYQWAVINSGYGTAVRQFVKI
ncbi:MAG: DUF5011 domain-containing protein [Bacteroidota bacterium]|nr:DUF5011 domain-containing protein [Bacteroidota bacterium]